MLKEIDAATDKGYGAGYRYAPSQGVSYKFLYVAFLCQNFFSVFLWMYPFVRTYRKNRCISC